MEQQPHNSGDDHDRDVPELERLWLGEIDLTGVVRQDDALIDVIGDAIGEAEALDGELPEWGARTLARALANERDDPQIGALHHFAVTGRVNSEAIAHELAELYERVDDEEIREWINWLGTYIINLGDDDNGIESTGSPQELKAEQHQLPEDADSSEEQSPLDDAHRGAQVPADPATQFTEHLNRISAEADARGERLAIEDVQAIAAMLAGLLVAMGVEDSAMARLAETGEIDLSGLKGECEHLKSIAWKTRDIYIWIEHLERYLSAK